MNFLLLIFATSLGPFLASTPYHPFFHHIFNIIPFSSFPLSLHQWISDGIMSFFFLTLSLEIKHAFTHGPLNHWKSIALPLCAAIGGMVGPALCALAVDMVFLGQNAFRGWAIPTATDAAFTMPLLALLPKLPAPLRIFLIALAIFDDLGAIIILALFYGQTPSFLWLFFSLIIVSALILCAYFKIQKTPLFIVTFLLLWFTLYHAGIEPTIAGVIIGFFLPETLIEKILPILEKLVSFLILPLFAFVSTEIDLHLFSLDYFKNSYFLSAALGLLIGKPLGISFTYICATKTRLLPKLQDVSFSHFLGICFLCGIGFTMSLLITELAYYENAALTAARCGVLFGSFLSAIIGFSLLKLWERRAS